MTASEYAIHPLTHERWGDFTELFGAHGAVGGCWCMYWRRGWRGKGVMRAMLCAAVEQAAAHGAKIVEAYPMDKSGKVDDLSGYMGVLKPFLDEGFELVARRSAGHPVVRKVVGQ